ncbi:hypothetical protein COCSUDRAFT_45666 [Coccomyxa subellipsoidea C-169]|uniref:Uncharacterized protein n=1 Tax=Coccomyxa subellipsoidea (strain C-169) TaxID=574566 RepID=I0YI18_COCSC|nr:hypothetical protein COCSUDRAFT_45666 [Coccomyxa subellipsoidea C-169]EIE18037.1 hypothetical protein COCSUDRAFT_45666 [Coccomyxa subellipsoidea C-169]|eukprot:XP_005642581.1 hypothetical protein COCSUDRAFT_45666 [Coccomyxa subellipsoidea C-169]
MPNEPNPYGDAGQQPPEAPLDLRESLATLTNVRIGLPQPKETYPVLFTGKQAENGAEWLIAQTAGSQTATRSVPSASILRRQLGTGTALTSVPGWRTSLGTNSSLNSLRATASLPTKRCRGLSTAELGRDASHKAGVEAQHSLAWYWHNPVPANHSLALLEAATNGRELNRLHSNFSLLNLRRWQAAFASKGVGPGVHSCCQWAPVHSAQDTGKLTARFRASVQN